MAFKTLHGNPLPIHIFNAITKNSFTKKLEMECSKTRAYLDREAVETQLGAALTI